MHHDWEGLISKVISLFSTWKSKFLSLGGRLTLVNFILTALPTYWMSIFKLPQWVIKEINQIRRDFLLFIPNIDHLGCCLISWKQLFKAKDQGYLGILDFEDFNNALLGKWWWQLVTGDNWCGSKVIHFNYGGSIISWNLFIKIPRRKSFFWNRLLNCLPTFSGCIKQVV